MTSRPQTLEWLTARIDELEGERDGLVRERDEASREWMFWVKRVQAEHSDRFEAEHLLHLALSTGLAECERLRAKLESTHRQNAIAWRNRTETSVDAWERNAKHVFDMQRKIVKLKKLAARTREAESLCNALMTAGLAECDRLRKHYYSVWAEDFEAAVLESANARMAMMRDAMEDWKTEVNGLNAKLAEVSKERDSLRNVVCWNVDCVHQAKALDMAAAVQPELDVARARIAELEREKFDAVVSYSKRLADEQTLRREDQRRIAELESAATAYVNACEAGFVAYDEDDANWAELRRVAKKP